MPLSKMPPGIVLGIENRATSDSATHGAFVLAPNVAATCLWGHLGSGVLVSPLGIRISRKPRILRFQSG